MYHHQESMEQVRLEAQLFEGDRGSKAVVGGMYYHRENTEQVLCGL